MENKSEDQSPVLRQSSSFKSRNLMNLLEEIFLKNNFEEMTPLIQNANLIPNILENLNYLNNKWTIDEKLEIINFLTINFRLIPHNVQIFSKCFLRDEKNISKKLYLIHILIDLYLNQSLLNPEETIMSLEGDLHVEKTILDCLIEIVNNFDVTKEIFDYVYQKLAKYFRVEKDKILQKSLLNKNLKLLSILYGEQNNSTHPCNYFYFTGNGSIKVSDRYLSSKEDRIKLNSGCVITLWFKLKYDFLENNFTINSNNNKLSPGLSDIINIKCTKEQNITLSLQNSKLFLKNYSEKDPIYQVNIDEWVYLSLIIKPKTFMKSTEFVLLINEKIINFQIPNFNCECEVNEASFFNNFCGNASSIIFLNKAISEEYVKNFREFPFGIYKEKILTEFMRRGYSKYMENSNMKFRSVLNSAKDSEGFKSLIESLKFFYTPFRFTVSVSDKVPNIYDICGRYHAIVTYDSINGIHLYKNLCKNIFFLGGINVTLPIIELMHTYRDTLLDTDTFCNFMEVIFNILNFRKKNMNDAVQKNFFQMLSLFIEKFPKEIFNEKVLEIFLKIGRSLFSLVDQCGLSTIYFDQVLLNEKIFTKFDINIQIQMWKSIYQFYVSDSSQIKSFMKMSKICFVLKYYDNQRFSKYCCKNHLEIFYRKESNDENSEKEKLENKNSEERISIISNDQKTTCTEEEIQKYISSPDMPTKIKDLINIIQLIIDNAPNESDDHTTLFKLLSLDLSPCLQKMILNIFIHYFSNSNISTEKKTVHLIKLLPANFTDILLYIFSISLLDIKCDIIKLLNILSTKEFRHIMKRSEERIFSIMKEFILTDNLKTYRNKFLSSTAEDLLINKNKRGLGVYSNINIVKYSAKRISTMRVEGSRELEDDQITETFGNEMPSSTPSNPIKTLRKPFLSAKHSERKSFKFDDEKLNEYFDTNNKNNLNICNEEEKLEPKLEERSSKHLFNEESLELQNQKSPTAPFEKMDLPLHKKKSMKLEISDEDNSPQYEEMIKASLPFKKFSDNFINKSNSAEIPVVDPHVNSLSDSGEINFNKKLKSLHSEPRGFSSIRTRQSLNTLKSHKINLDIDVINSNYKFGGEKGELNLPDDEEEKDLESKIKQLAKHCVDFMNGTASNTDCEQTSLLTLSYRFGYTVSNIKDEKKENTLEKKTRSIFNLDKTYNKNDNDSKDFLNNQPRSVKGTTKINFKKFSIIKDNVIEEDPNEAFASPFRRANNLVFSKDSQNSHKLSICKLNDSRKNSKISEKDKEKEIEIDNLAPIVNIRNSVNVFSESINKSNTNKDLTGVKIKLSFDNLDQNSNSGLKNSKTKSIDREESQQKSETVETNDFVINPNTQSDIILPSTNTSITRHISNPEIQIPMAIQAANINNYHSVEVTKSQSRKKNIEIMDDYLLIDKNQENPNTQNDKSNFQIKSQTPSNLNYQSTLTLQESDLENLDQHFNKEIYDKQLSNLYDSLLEWLLNKNCNYFKRSPSKNLYLDDGDDIVNPGVINIILKLALNSDISYVQKLMQDFHLILINNKENCRILYRNTNFYNWLIETSFKHFQSKEMISHHTSSQTSAGKIDAEKYSPRYFHNSPFSNHSTSYSIYELGKKIHTELIINTIIKEENLRSEPMNRLNFLLSWGVYYKNIYDYSRKIISDVNEFIKNLIKDILNAFKDKISTCSPNVDLSIWENFLSFTILTYEYMTFYNLEKSMRNNSIGLSEMSSESIIVPRTILSGLNYQDPYQERHNSFSDELASKNKIKFPEDNVSHLWCDYKLFESIYSSYNKIWNFNKSVLVNLNISPNIANSNLVLKYEKIIEEILSGKKRKDIFLDDLRILTYYYKSDFSNNFNNYDIPVIKCISNLLAITISVTEDENELKFWLEEYEQFLIFLILASSNLSMISMDYYNLVQDLTMDTVVFGLCFLLDEIFNVTKNPNLLKYYERCIKNVFVLCAMILEYIYKQCEKKKKKVNINIFSNLMKKKNKKSDLTKTAVYRIFNEYILDKNNNPILNYKAITEMKLSQFVDVPQIFKKEIWRNGLLNNPLLKEKLKKVFDFSTYEKIMRERNDVIKKFVPVYEHKFTVRQKSNRGDKLITSPSKNNLSTTNLKSSVYKTIENLLPNFDYDMKVYKNSVFVSNKQRRCVYRWLKKKLFSWRGMWSDRDLFFNHPEKLKLKVMNHYTSQFSRPILIPILDVDYYIPKFSRFDIKNLFNPQKILNEENPYENNELLEKNLSYKISLDVNSILDKHERIERTNSIFTVTNKGRTQSFVLETPNKNNENKIEQNNELLNQTESIQTYIKDIYKLNNQSIWSKYSEINNKLDFFTSKETEYTELYLNRFKVKSSDINLRKYENFYECCFVKASHHIKGIFYLNKEGITFRVISRKNQAEIQNNENLPLETEKENYNSFVSSSIFVNNTTVGASNLNYNTFSNSLPTINSPSPTQNYGERSSIISKTSFEIVDPDEDYNSDRFTCWGSFFEAHHKDSNILNLNFPYEEIKFLFKRKYYYKKTGLEMFTTKNKSYYFNFKTFSDREMVTKSIAAHLDVKREIRIDTKDNIKDKEEMIIGYENMVNSIQLRKNVKPDYLSSKIDSWLNWKISNFEFLMWLNLISNRSFSDLTQYPVFPWILKNYQDNRFNLPEDMRDFELPMGMMELDEKGKTRRRLYIEDYKSMINEREMNDVPRVYGSHYSNPIYVSHYLTRIFPYAHIMIELQGDRFDDPNRLFNSLANSFSCATSLKGDVRELTPEFYYLPEFFLNLNDLNLGIRTDHNMNKQVVNHVELPKWSDNNPYEFIIKMRTALETEEVSMCINNWIDLIFGYKQRGRDCENSYNVYPNWSYEDFNIDSIEKNERASYFAQIEFGLTPSQTITRPLSEKFSIDQIRRGKQLTESRELRSYWNNSNQKNKKEKPLMLKIKVLDTDKVMCVFNNNSFYTCRFFPNESKYNMDIVSKSYITSDNIYKITNRMPEFYSECLNNHPMVIYNNGKIIAQGGYFDGNIAVSYQEGNNMKLYYYNTQKDSPITCLVMDKEEQYAFAGSKSGVLYIFKVNDYVWKLETYLFDHYSEITFISVSNSMNIYATSSLDGYVNLYTFPSNRLFRSIKLPDNLTADYVFISNSPLPSFCVYSRLSKMFYCYSINGFLLCEEFEECKFILSPQVLTDITFTDYLVKNILIIFRYMEPTQGTSKLENSQIWHCIKS
jgi:hypothetical protein